MDSREIQIFLENNITDLFSYLGATQGLILAIIVLNYPKQHQVSNRLLSLFLLIISKAHYFSGNIFGNFYRNLVSSGFGAISLFDFSGLSEL